MTDSPFCQYELYLINSTLHIYCNYKYDNGGINLENITTLINTTAEGWKEYIDLDENEEGAEDIRKHTLLGRPSGTKEFIAKSGKRIGRGYWHVGLFENLFNVGNYVFCYLWLAF